MMMHCITACFIFQLDLPRTQNASWEVVHISQLHWIVPSTRALMPETYRLRGPPQHDFSGA